MFVTRTNVRFHDRRTTGEGRRHALRTFSNAVVAAEGLLSNAQPSTTGAALTAQAGHERTFEHGAKLAGSGV